jgi:nitrogen regulatory protein P-II 1
MWLAGQAETTAGLGSSILGDQQFTIDRVKRSAITTKDFVVKQVVAVVKPYLAEQVLEALRRAPLEALSVTEVKGFGRQKSYLDEYTKSEYAEAFLPKIEITMWVDDARVDEVLQKVVAVARSGRMGDGKIFVLPVASFW